MTSRVDVELVEWRVERSELEALRRRVFIEEQGVPKELEWDGEDADALHVLARRVEGTPVGTGRLLADGHIGRMAVLAEHRRQGIGSAILERLMRAAAERGLQRVFLNAQVSALPFYRRHGFAAEGQEFVDAGIPHRRMSRTLSPGRADDTPAPDAAPLVQLVAGARHTLELFLQRLEADLLDDPEFLTAVQQLLLRHPNNRLQICLQRIDGARATNPRLFALLERLPSRIELRQAAENERDRQENFVLVDRRRFLRRISPSQRDWHQGDDRSEAERLAALFDEIWSSGETHPELRTLSL